ncbi:MAG: hypothetical protein ACLP0J_05225 [Solirubrobacteraceae bacterium]
MQHDHFDSLARRVCEYLRTMLDMSALITGVDFVCIPAKDLDAMTAFYGDTLGLPFVKRWGDRLGVEY